MYVIQLQKIVNVPEKDECFNISVLTESGGVIQPMKDVINIKSVVAVHNAFEG